MEAKDLVAKDNNLFSKNTSDPYVVTKGDFFELLMRETTKRFKFLKIYGFREISKFLNFPVKKNKKAKKKNYSHKKKKLTFWSQL